MRMISIFFGLAVLVAAVYLWGIVDVLRRSNTQWVHAKQGRTFWLVWMIVGLLVALARFTAFPIPFRGLLSFILIVGFVYYAGPERQRMGVSGGGSGWGGGSRGTRGGW